MPIKLHVMISILICGVNIVVVSQGLHVKQTSPHAMYWGSGNASVVHY